ncbi:hypothetical protein FKO01_17000 [Mesorhizobium sp. B2-3-3]|nr:hypothetical protein FKO01_17000 [Mesorhizobium sp. B2-3-3]
MNSFIYDGELNIIAKATASRSADSADTVDGMPAFARPVHFPTRLVAPRQPLEIDKILLSG